MTRGAKSRRSSDPSLSPSEYLARGAVISTPELLLLILENLDLKTLLVEAQLVCREWRQAIAYTISLQKRLFFLADPDWDSDNGYPTPNPLLVKFFRPFYPTELPGFREGRFSSFDEVDEGYYDTLAGLRDDVGGERSPAFARREASWRRMLPTQPPPRRLHSLKIRRSTILGWKPVILEFPDGLRMGELWEHVCSQFLRTTKVTVLNRMFIDESSCRQMTLSDYHRRFWKRVGRVDLLVFGIMIDDSDRLDMKQRREFYWQEGIHISRRVGWMDG